MNLRRAVSALAVAGLAVTLAGQAPSYAAPAGSPAGHGAAWLSHQLHRGVIHNSQFDFDDYGLTADTVIALKTIGGHPKVVLQSRRALARHVDDYTTFKKSIFAGPTAKLLVVAEQTGARPHHFGGVDLVSRLADRVATTAPIEGRIQDKSSSGDFANAIGQIFAARGLVKAHDPSASSVLQFLLEQQCTQGYFRLDFNADKTAADQGCTATSPADNDVTSLAVVELSPLVKGRPALRSSLKRATAWLVGHQKANGSFGGGPSTSASNTNSTGLAAWALRTQGRCAAARDAARWVHNLQVQGNVAGTPLAGEVGGIALDRAGMRAARKNGIDETTRDQWRRATAQAAPGLLALTRCGA